MPGLDDDTSGPSDAPTPTTETEAPPANSTTTSEGAPTESPDAPDTSASLEAVEVSGISGVLAAIQSGQPLPYTEDGQTFQNREGLLPQQPIGYYREYTVETPGSPDRGARRLVIGEGGETYYTADHYSSFTRIEPADFEQ